MDAIRVYRIPAETKEHAAAALHAILTRAAGRPITLQRHPQGKPYLPALPHLKFNFSRTPGMALVAIANGTELGVDVERLRPMPDLERIAERFLLPGDADELAALPNADREREFFRRWVRAEALWKAAGLGLYSAGAIPEGEWDVQDIDAGPGFAAAVASSRRGLAVTITDWSELRSR
jgi:4'-phosphopantetheinyl transferase